MTYVRAKQENWNLKDLKFNVVGDVYGGLWALENNQAQGFLWEKNTTYPFTEQKKCRYIDEVVTPWPCFVIAVRSELLEENEALLKTVFERVHQEAKALKENPNAAEIIAWRYNLKLDQTQSWLSETGWNYDNSLMKDSIENVVNTLESLELISVEEKENWEEKVF
jgi:ABC-type nitrate/sulfonate/bicarbonate transport system substrate-binding protein